MNVVIRNGVEGAIYCEYWRCQLSNTQQPHTFILSINIDWIDLKWFFITWIVVYKQVYTC